MKRILGIAVAVTLALAALAGPAVAKADKVDICHVNGSTGAAPFPPPPDAVVDIVYGRVISVSANALEAHHSHGDGPVLHTPQDNPLVWVYGEAFGVAGNSNCAFNVPIPA